MENTINRTGRNWITKTNREYPHTHITKYNFGRLLPEGIRVNIVQQIGDSVAVKDHCGNIWHGNISDLTKTN